MHIRWSDTDRDATNIGPAEPGPQPGGRAPAPGPLGLVQAFVNSNYDLEQDHGAELLDSPEALGRWLYTRNLIPATTQPTGTDLHQALAVREGLRALLIAKHEDRPLDPMAIRAMNAAAPQLPVTVELHADGPSFAAPAAARSPLGVILAAAAGAMLDGTWQRLKACRECNWAFYDRSRNQASNWCSMKVCGGRVKQRAYYERTSTRTSPSAAHRPRRPQS
jgi:predicted RNA-binding Zn ribbon-like protein